MGHPGNWSDRKRAEVEATERAKRIFGWWRAAPGDRWGAVDSPAGVLARGSRLLAGCSSMDCSRRIRFDPRFWIERGLGDTNLATIKLAYMCARTPCGLRWNNEIYPQGVPLICFADTEGAEVTMTCRACRFSKTLSARRFVDWLIERRRSPNVPAYDLRGTVSGACSTCGERDWQVALRAPGLVIAAPPGGRLGSVFL